MNNYSYQKYVSSGKMRFFLTLLVLLSLLMLPIGCTTSSTGDKDEDEAVMEKYEAPEIKLENAAIKFYFPGQQPKSWDEVRAKLFDTHKAL